VSDCSFPLTSTTNRISCHYIVYGIFYFYVWAFLCIPISYVLLYISVFDVFQSFDALNFLAVCLPTTCSGFRADRTVPTCSVRHLPHVVRLVCSFFYELSFTPGGNWRISFPSKPPSIISRSGMSPLLLCDRVRDITSEPPSLIIHSEGVGGVAQRRDY